MAKVDDLLQSGTKQIVLAVVAWLAHGCPPDSESRRRRNHEPPQSGIPKRKKTATHTRLSCKIEYLLRSNHGHSSIASRTCCPGGITTRFSDFSRQGGGSRTPAAGRGRELVA